MSGLVSDALEIAERDGTDPSLEIFRATANEQQRHLAWALACCLDASRDDLRSACADAWPTEVPSETDIEEFLFWPFVDSASARWKIDEDIGADVRSEFRKMDPDAFLRVHNVMAEREAAVDQSDWYVRGRTAFYLAAVDEDASITEFESAFADPPPFDRTRCRIWLSGLVDRQSQMLPGHVREVSFYKAFSLYAAGGEQKREEALKLFDAVIGDDPPADVYSAIAEHLKGVLIRSQDLKAAVDLFQSSVTLSHEIELHDNEVMATNSLIWAVVELDRDYERADILARENLMHAKDLGDIGFVNWTTVTQAPIEWELYKQQNKELPEDAVRVADEIAARLEQAAESSWESGDIETMVVALNHSACTYRDVREYEHALSVAETAVARAQNAAWKPPHLKKMTKTLGSLRRGLSGAQLDRASELIDDINAAFDPQNRDR